MKKRQAKRLQTCTGCGKRGINLKLHKCKAIGKPAKRVDVEIVAPPESLKQIEAHLTPLVGQIQKRSEDLLYDLVEAGLYLMKSQESHRVSNVGHAVDGKFDGSAGDTGFRGWLEQKYPTISRASAYNYITMARNCGLTIQDNSGAIDALRKKHALKGKTAAGLLKDSTKPASSTDDEQEEDGTKWNLIRDAAVSLRDSSETVIELKPHMSKKAYSTVCARALRTLEELTGSTWDMVQRRKGREPFREHGDVYELGS